MNSVKGDILLHEVRYLYSSIQYREVSIFFFNLDYFRMQEFIVILKNYLIIFIFFK